MDNLVFMPCGTFPLLEISQGARACRDGWRNRGEGIDMLAVIKSDLGTLLLEREAEKYCEYEDFSDIEDMLATDWMVERKE